ncbi:hypothetical protein KY339_03685, partial [Candidatus Woesearchaeota archaeon]|nr:hypothetical protein [Candidatus Woesearchaeota archaeon]
IENIGDRTVRNLVFTLVFPPDIQITETKDNAIVEGGHVMYQNETATEWEQGSNVKWVGDIGIGDYKEFRFSFIATRPIDEEFEPKLVYFDGFEEIEELGEKLSIETEFFFDMELKFADEDYATRLIADSLTAIPELEDILPGEEGVFIIHLENEDPDDDDLDVNKLDIYIPDGLQLMGSEGLRISNVGGYENLGAVTLQKISRNHYQWKGKLTEDDKIISFRFKALWSDDQRIVVSAEIENDDGVIEKDTAEETIEVELEELIVWSNFKEENEFNSKQRKKFSLYIQNPNPDISFKDLNVKLNIPWMETEDAFVKYIGDFGYFNIIDREITLPEVNVRTIYDYNVTVDYKTEYDEVFHEEFEEEIIVRPLEDLEITHNIDDSSLEANQETTVTVEIRNQGWEDLGSVEVFDIVPEELSPDGKTSKVVEVNKDSELIVYSYKITAPEISAEKKFEITTNATYKKLGQYFSSTKTTEIKVEAKELDIDITRRIDKEDHEYFRGEILKIDYKVENEEEDEILKNVILRFPLQYEFDVVGSRTFAVSDIYPEETVLINDEHKIRPKFNGTLEINSTVFEFNDAFGNTFFENSSTEKIDVTLTTIFGPAIIINKSVEKKKVNNTDEFTVYLTLGNIGNADVTARIVDGRLNRDIYMEAGEQATVQYKTKEEEIGKITLPQAVAQYSYEGITYYAGSNIADIEVVKYVPPPVEEEEVPEEFEEEEVPEEEIIEEEITPEKKFPFKYVIYGLVALVLLYFLFIYRPKIEVRR